MTMCARDSWAIVASSVLPPVSRMPACAHRPVNGTASGILLTPTHRFYIPVNGIVEPHVAQRVDSDAPLLHKRLSRSEIGAESFADGRTLTAWGSRSLPFAFVMAWMASMANAPTLAFGRFATPSMWFTSTRNCNATQRQPKSGRANARCHTHLPYPLHVCLRAMGVDDIFRQCLERLDPEVVVRLRRCSEDLRLTS